MPLPTLFTSITFATGAQLDADFDVCAKIGTIPGAITGTNTLTFTPTAAITPTISAYANYMTFGGVIANTNTGAVTFQVGALAALNVYFDGAAGPAVLAGGELVLNNFAVFAFDSTLNSGAGGFHLLSMIPVTEMLDLIGGTRGNLLARGSATWGALAVGNSSQVLAGGTDPAYSSLSAVLDNYFGTAPGTVLQRGMTVWVAAPPGASGTVLTSQGSATIAAWL
jgi:hypothetical protein